MRKITALVLLVALISALMVTPASAKEKSEKINEYIKTSFDAYNVKIVDSALEFQNAINNGEITPAIEDVYGSGTTYTIEVKNDGCLLVKSSGIFTVKDVSQKEKYTICSNSSTSLQLLPLEKGDKIEILRNSDFCRDSLMKIYLAFTPSEKIYHIDQSVKNNNKTLSFTFGNIYDEASSLVISASKKKIKTRDVIGNTIVNTWGNTTVTYDYTSVSEGDDAVLTLPEEGEYTLFIKLTYNNKNIAYAVLSLDTDKYIKPTLDKLEAPISAIYGTNVIVGYAEPSATVYVEYEGQKYQQKANRKGIYRMVLDEDMKEGTPFKIWQSKNKITSKKVKYRVTDNV